MMRKINAAIFALLIVFMLSACTTKAMDFKPDNITLFEVIELITGNKLSIDPQSGQFSTAQELAAEFKSPFKDSGPCDPEDGHLYQFTIFEGEKVSANITVNADGSYCQNKRHYTPADTGDSLSVGTYENLFAGLHRKEDNKPYTPDNIERSGGATVLVEIEGWTYISEHVKMGGKFYTVLAREKTEEQKYEVIIELNEVYGDRTIKAVEYVQNSYEASGDDATLYFTAHNSETNYRQLYCFSTVSDTWTLLLDSPCSNMIIFEGQRDGEFEDIGWIIADNQILAIKLDKKPDENPDNNSDEKPDESIVDETKSSSIEKLGGISEINDSFFNSLSAGFDIKYTEISVSENGRGLIDIKVTEKNSAKKNIIELVYDTINKTVTIKENKEMSKGA